MPFTDKVAAAPGVNTKSHYCWSHGPQNTHGSGDCNFPRAHHKKTATFENKQGGALVFTKTVGGGGNK